MILPNLPIVFTSRLDRLVVREVSQQLRLQILQDNSVLFDELYIADVNGTVVITGLDEIIESYMLASESFPCALIPAHLIASEFRFLYTDSATPVQDISVGILYSKADLGTTDLLDFTSTHFLTLFQGNKRTRPDSIEELFVAFIASGSRDVTVTAQYENPDGSFYKVETSSAFNILTPDLGQIDVSPALFNIDGKKLLSYNVRCGNRFQNYIVDRRVYLNLEQFVFLNNFGVPETCFFVGERTTDIKPERTYGLIVGIGYKQINVKYSDEQELDTGILTQSEADWIVDFLVSPEIVRYDGSGIGPQITVLENTATRTSLPSELPRFKFKFRRTDSDQRLVSLRARSRIFDKTFDYTFN